jgi:O-antigen ligase
MSFQKKLNNSDWGHLLLAISLASIHFAPAVSSISLILFLVVVIRGYLISIEAQQKKHWMLQGLFLLFFAGILFYDAQFEGGVDRSWANLQVALPLFFLPMLIRYGQLNHTEWQRVWYLYTLPLIWTLIPVAINYLANSTFLSQMVLESKPLPLYTMVYHIEYSLLITVVLLFLTFLWINKKELRTAFFTVNYVLLWIGLHLISARTGLLSYWLGMGWLIFKHSEGFKLSKLKWVIAICGLSLFFIPTIKNRIINSYQDIQTTITGGDINHKSFGQRVEAWKATSRLIKEKPFTGVGSNAFFPKLMGEYEEMGSTLRPSNWTGPHNQWLQWAAEYGLIAFLIGLLLLGMQLFYWQNQIIRISWVLVLGVASLFESIAERQSGVLAIVVFTVLLTSIDSKEKREKVSGSVAN